MSDLLYTAEIVAPVFVMVALGGVLRRAGIVDEPFNATASKAVFNAALPAMVFRELSSVSFGEIFNPAMALFVFVAVPLMFVIGWAISVIFCSNGRDQGAFIQGAVRGNFAVVGFAFIRNAFGEQALGRAALVLAIIMPLYNVLSILALTLPLRRENAYGWKDTMKSIVANPLILALAAALPFSVFQFPIHSIVRRSVDYAASMTLPLALISIGSSLSFKRIQEKKTLTLAASAIKLILMPFLGTAAALLVGFRGEELGILFFLFAAPSAIAGYIMAYAMDSNGPLAGDIVFATTVASTVTISLGVFLLRHLGYF